MKKIALLILSVIIAVSLTACSKYPKTDLENNAWNREWEMLGTVLGVEPPQNGFTLLENDTVLTGDDTYFASWVSGEPTKWTNDAGKETDLYPAQIYLMLYGCGDEDAAKEALNDYLSKEESTYTVQDKFEETVSGQTYTCITYTCGSETNPYSRGISAFGLYQNYVINAELTCTESFTGDEESLLFDFLGGCHFAKDFE